MNQELKYCEEARRFVHGSTNSTDYFLHFSEVLYAKLVSAWEDISRLEDELIASSGSGQAHASQPQLVMEALQQQHNKFDVLCQHIAAIHLQADQLRDQFLRTFEIRGANGLDPFKALDEAQPTVAPATPMKLTWNPGQGGFQGSTFSGAATTFGAFGQPGSSGAGFGFSSTTALPPLGGFSSSAFSSSALGAPTGFGATGGFGVSSAGFGAPGFGAPGFGAPSSASTFGFAPSVSSSAAGFGIGGFGVSSSAAFGGSGPFMPIQPTPT
eukprot:EG_transcript_19488